MRLPAPLVEGRLVRRYKRFLADVELEDGSFVTAYTPNTGSMTQCAVPGYPVLLSRSDNPKRKLPWTLELIRVGDHWVDTHTHRSNRVVEEALRANLIEPFCGFDLRPEYPFGDSRIDFYLEKGQQRALLEVKNVTLIEERGLACFPDAVTTRGQKHLRELMRARALGWRAAVFFLVQRYEATGFCPADSIDPEYGRLLREAAACGVEVLAYRTRVTQEETRVESRIPVLL